MSEKNLFQRLLAVMDDVGAIGKGGQADKSIGGFMFHSIDDVSNALRAPCIKHGVFISVTVARGRDDLPAIKTSIREIQKSGRDGSGSYVQVERRSEIILDITFVNADNPEDNFTVQGFGEGLDYGDKASGKATSYALKTVLLANFQMRGQPDNEGDPTTDSRTHGQPQQQRSGQQQKRSGQQQQRRPPQQQNQQQGQKRSGQQQQQQQRRPPQQEKKEWPPDWAENIELTCSWQELVLHTTQIRGRALGALRADQLAWMQTRWIYPGNAPTKQDRILKKAIELSKLKHSEPVQTQPEPQSPEEGEYYEETPF